VNFKSCGSFESFVAILAEKSVRIFMFLHVFTQARMRFENFIAFGTFYTWTMLEFHVRVQFCLAARTTKFTLECFNSKMDCGDMASDVVFMNSLVVTMITLIL